MNLAFYIYKFLQKTANQVEIPDFGVFFIEKTHAQVDEKASKILPPREIISFEKREVKENHRLVDFIASELGISREYVDNQLKKEVELWNENLSTNKELNLDYLGSIEIRNIEIVFTQQNLSNSMEYFGLEEVLLEEVGKYPQDYIFQKSILWIFLVVAPILVLVFLAVNNKDLLFGKTSFENTHRIENKVKPVVEDTIIKKIDSVMIDKENVLPLQKVKK